MLFKPLRVFIPVSLFFLFGSFRFVLGIIAGHHSTITSIIGILSAIAVPLFGILADQFASIKKNIISNESL
jgi:hypothetical protein